MTVHFIGAGPGAADLMTLRGRALLGACPICLYAGSTVSPEMLAFCRKDVRLVDSAPMSLDEIEATCADADASGLDVARLHGGDLALYSAVNEQIGRLRARGIATTMTPGVSALGASACAIGRELTLPEHTQSVVLTRLAGRASAVLEELEALAATGALLALHLSVNRLDEIVERLGPVLGADCPVAVIERASWPEERVWQATLRTIVALVGETVPRMGLVLVGRALAAEGGESALYRHGYERRFRPG